MRLWYKAWRETRTRFAFIALVLVAFCGFAVFFRDPGSNQQAFGERIYQVMYAGTAKGVFGMLVMFLGLGGLLRERAHRTVFFTLALPVSRLRLVLTHLAAGIGEVALLSFLPAVLIPLLARLIQQPYPVSQALHFATLWFGCGSLIFAAAFLLSVVLSGEYTAPVVCYIALMVQALLASWRPLKPHRLNLFWIMGDFGTMHWDAGQHLLISSPLPWTKLLTIGLLSFGMLAMAARITQKQDF